MKELKPVVANLSSHQAGQIEPEELEEAARKARERAIEVRRRGVAVSAMRSSYNLGGWKGLFEDYIEEPSSSSLSFQKSEKSDRPVSGAGQTDNDSGSAEMPLCPSGRPESANPVVFGVVGGTAEAPQVAYLSQTVPLSDELLALSGSVGPTEMFRIASNCAAKGCHHFDGSNCRLAMRVVEKLAPTVETLPECQIRPHCRWWQQEGKSACLRCPQVVTDNYNPSDLYLEVAGTAALERR